MFMFDDSDGKSSVWTPKNPKLMRLAGWIFFMGICLMGILIALTLTNPKTWLIVAVCSVPFFIALPFVCVAIWVKGHDYG